MFPLLWLVLRAWGADGYLSSQVPDQVRKLEASSGQRVVVIVDSGNDVATFQRLLGGTTVTALAPGGVQGTLETAGAACGLHVTRAGAGNFWAVAPVGQCTAAAAPLTPSAEAVAPAAAATPEVDATVKLVDELVALKDNTARKAKLVAMLGDASTDPSIAGRLGEAVAVVSSLEAAKRNDSTVVRLFLKAALDPDPAVRVAAVTAAKANGDPPMASQVAATPVVASAPVVTSPPAPAADPAKLREYQNRRLVRGAVQFTSGGMSVTNGTGYGYVSTVHTWTVRDGGGAPFKTVAFARAVGDAATVQRMEKTKRNLLIGAGVGSVVFLGAMAALPAVVQSDAIGDDLTVAALGGTGLGLAVSLPFLYSAKNNMMARVYTPAEADRWVASYNTALRTELGLSEADVKDIDLAPAR